MSFTDRFRTRRCERCGNLFGYRTQPGRNPWICPPCRQAKDDAPANPASGDLPYWSKRRGHSRTGLQ